MHCFKKTLLCMACFIAGCTKICSSDFAQVNSYLSISIKRETNLGDTITIQVSSPFESINLRNNKSFSIKKTKNINDFIITVIRVDTMLVQGQYMPALNLFKIETIFGKTFKRSENPLFENVNLYSEFEKDDTSFIVKLKLIPQAKGVYMIEHSKTMGKIWCTEIDFIPALRNSSQNLDLFIPGLTEYSRKNVFFFKVN